MIRTTTSTAVARLPMWAVSVPVYQQGTYGSNQVALTAISRGPEHVAAALPGGQSMGSGRQLIATVVLLGGAPAVDRFESNLQVTGSCGTASVMP